MKIELPNEFAMSMVRLYLKAEENDSDTLSIYIPLKNINAELECEITFSIKENQK